MIGYFTLIGRKIETVKTYLFQPHKLYQSWRAVVARRCCFSSLIKDAAVLGLILGLQADFPLFSLTTAADRPVDGHHTQARGFLM